MVNGEFTCNQRYVLSGSLTCDGMIDDIIECSASTDGVYLDENNTQIYYCPCDNSSTCAHILKKTYEDEIFTVEEIPTYFVVQKNVSVVSSNKKMDIITL